MSTNKHIDAVCLVVCVLMLLITGLFINGEAFGLAPAADGDAGDGQFTANDLNANWDRSGAAQITLAGDGGSVKGGGAYINGGDVHILYAGTYVLSGELTDGSVIVEASNSDKIWLLLDGVSLHCDDSAALVIEQAGKVFLTLADGTENFISSGAEYSAEAVSAGIDGAVYSRDDLTVNGGGCLSVTAEYKHGIVCNDDLVITGGKIEITAAQDGIHANDSARFANMELTVSAGDDGITVSNDEETAYVYVESGTVSIPSCYEGIEAVDITIAGGTLDIRPTDDGINATGRAGTGIHISGGDITIINETGRDADGLDSNGDIEISGGKLFISVNGSGGSAAIDCGTENGGRCTISGGTVVVAGSSTMAEGFDSSSEQCFIMYNTSTAAAGTEVVLKNAAGSVLVSEVIPCAFSSIVISTPELQTGETCTISVGGAEAEIVVDNSSSGGFAMAGMFGGRGGRGERPFDGQADMGSTPEGPAFGGMGGSGTQNGVDIRREPGGTEAAPGETRLPEETHGQNGMDFGRGDSGRFMQWGQNYDGPQDAAVSGNSAVSPGTLALVGVSVLFLLAGILIASKVKHQ